jgi:hypothetical protein
MWYHPHITHRQSPGFGLQLAVHRLRRARQFDVAVALDRGVAVNGTFGFGDLLLIDTAQGAPRPVMAVLANRYCPSAGKRACRPTPLELPM